MSTPDLVRSSFASDFELQFFFHQFYQQYHLCFAMKVAPEFTATSFSIPVPTNGDFILINGTACLIIFDPINAH